MSDIAGFKNIRLLKQQPTAIAEMPLMRAISGMSKQLDKRFMLEVTFENDHVVNVPLTEALYETIIHELKHQPGVGVEQRMAARGAIASAGLEKEAPKEKLLPLDATGEQVYDALREVAGIERVKEQPKPMPEPQLPGVVDHDELEDGTGGVLEPAHDHTDEDDDFFDHGCCDDHC